MNEWVSEVKENSKLSTSESSFNVLTCTRLLFFSTSWFAFRVIPIKIKHGFRKELIKFPSIYSSIYELIKFSGKRKSSFTKSNPFMHAFDIRSLGNFPFSSPQKLINISNVCTSSRRFFKLSHCICTVDYLCR